MEQCYAIKFCVKLGKSGNENVQILKEAYKDKVLSQSQIYKWHTAFRNGQQNAEDEPHKEQHSTTNTNENIERLRSVLNTDRELSLRSIAKMTGLAKTELVPKMLSPKQINSCNGFAGNVGLYIR